jgi:hypothetical protein
VGVEIMGGYEREKRDGPHIKFVEDLSYKGLTKKWHAIMTGYPHNLLATIKWHGAWHKYVIQYKEGTMMDKGCHKEVDTFIDEQMRLRREARRKV